MLTRARTQNIPKECHVVLQVRPTGDLFDLGAIEKFEDALPAAIQRGGIPESWDVAILHVNPDRVIVACDQSHVDLMQQFNLNRTWSKAKPKFNVSPPLKVPKAKAVSVLPEKLVGPAADAAFTSDELAWDFPD
jgi:hypothetical protein